MDNVFDQRYMVKGEDVPIRLKFKDVVYVFEDVDAASKIVHRREDAPARKETTTVTVTHDGSAPLNGGGNGEAEDAAAGERAAIGLAIKASLAEGESKAADKSTLGPLKLSEMLAYEIPDKPGPPRALSTGAARARAPSAPRP
jgi:chaperone BCS1